MSLEQLFLMAIAISATVYNNVRSSAFCLVEASCQKVLVLFDILVADWTSSFYAWFTARKAVRTSVNVANLVIHLSVCYKNF